MATEQDKRPQGGNAVMQLLQFAGSRRWLAFAGSAAVAFLASEEAGYITGQVLAVDGGMAM